ncbi:MAG: hypothetical protein JST00_30170 [Deltaproteobacteria bacterium]|nr:hypothetical protein [Deltaproteobacteria bacterium]
MVATRRFAFASITVLVGIVAVASPTAAGCSATAIVPSVDEGGDGSRGIVDATSDRTKDSGRQEDPGSGGGGGWPCPSPDAINATTFPWKPPSKTPGACTEGELQSFVAFVEKTDDPQKWKDGITNAACRDCVFAKETTTWPPLILNAAGQLVALNVGGCIAIASGKESCGKAYQQWRDCYLEACTDCAFDESTFTTCIAAANKTACKKAFDAIVGPTGCGDAETASNAEAACDGETYVFEGGIRAQCIGLGDGDL